MRATILALLSLLAAGFVQAAEPYPRSTLVGGLTWDQASYRSGGSGGDRWPATSSAGRVYTAWGDGRIGCKKKVSFGLAAISGGPGTNLTTLGCGPSGTQSGKFHALLALDGALYGIVRMQNKTKPKAGFAIWRSTNGGKSWQPPKPAWVFPNAAGELRPEAFTNFGPDHAGARDGYVYLPSIRTVDLPREVYLLRVPRGRLQDRAAYEWFAGAAGAPAWSALASAARPIFVDPGGVETPKMSYQAALGRYLLTVAHGGRSLPGGSGGKIGVFEAPEPWGPWATIDYQESWLGIKGGFFLGAEFPSLWTADAGRTLWAVFSCYDRSGGTCGVYHDHLNLIRATLQPATP